MANETNEMSCLHGDYLEVIRSSDNKVLKIWYETLDERISIHLDKTRTETLIKVLQNNLEKMEA